MDLRQYLEQMQEVGDGSDAEPEDGAAAAVSDVAPSGDSAAAVTAAMHPEADGLIQAAGASTLRPVVASHMSQAATCKCVQANQHDLEAVACCVQSWGAVVERALQSPVHGMAC